MHVAAGAHVAPLVANHVRRQPRRLGVRADEHEQRIALGRRCAPRVAVSTIDRLELLAPSTATTWRASRSSTFAFVGKLVDQVLRHARRERRAAHEHRHRLGVVGEQHRRLARRVAAADQVMSRPRGRALRCARRRSTRRGRRARRRRDVERAPRDAGGEHDRPSSLRAPSSSTTVRRPRPSSCAIATAAARRAARRRSAAPAPRARSARRPRGRPGNPGSSRCATTFPPGRRTRRARPASFAVLPTRRTPRPRDRPVRRRRSRRRRSPAMASSASRAASPLREMSASSASSVGKRTTGNVSSAAASPAGRCALRDRAVCQRNATWLRERKSRSAWQARSKRWPMIVTVATGAWIARCCSPLIRVAIVCSNRGLSSGHADDQLAKVGRIEPAVSATLRPRGGSRSPARRAGSALRRRSRPAVVVDHALDRRRSICRRRGRRK